MQNPFIPNYGPTDLGIPQLTTPVGTTSSATGGNLNTGMPGAAGGFQFPEVNLDFLKLGIGGIQTLGNLWNSFQAQKLAEEQFDYTKGITDTNLTNSIQSYNTSLTDRINARAFTEGRPAGYADQYISENQLSDRRRQY